MKHLANTIQLVRNLRKGKHDSFAIQKALARIRNNTSGTENRISSEQDIACRQEPHGQIHCDQTYLPDIGVPNQGEE